MTPRQAHMIAFLLIHAFDHLSIPSFVSQREGVGMHVIYFLTSFLSLRFLVGGERFPMKKKKE